MPVSPVCLVNNTATTNGVNVPPSSTVTIRLQSTVDVTSWYLRVTGTDELSSVPTLALVNGTTHLVQSPSSTVTFTFPASFGSALGFRSDVQGVGGPLETTFGVYSLTAFNTRVGFVTEAREGNTAFGWASKINPLIRSAGGTIIETPLNKHMPALVTTGVGRELACGTGLGATPHPAGALYVSVNGMVVTDIGYGVTSGCTCYWSNDGGVTSKLRANVAVNDRLYWNGPDAGFELATTDFFDFYYEVSLA